MQQLNAYWDIFDSLPSMDIQQAIHEKISLTTSSRLFLENLPSTMATADLYSLFQEHGNIIEASLDKSLGMYCRVNMLIYVAGGTSSMSYVF